MPARKPHIYNQHLFTAWVVKCVKKFKAQELSGQLIIKLVQREKSIDPTEKPIGLEVVLILNQECPSPASSTAEIGHFVCEGLKGCPGNVDAPSVEPFLALLTLNHIIRILSKTIKR